MAGNLVKHILGISEGGLGGLLGGERIHFGLWGAQTSVVRDIVVSAAIRGKPKDAQGQPVDLEGYYMPSLEKASQIMRPSAALNEILDTFKAVSD